MIMLETKELSKLLKEINVLYVEDDMYIKGSISQTLEYFSKNVILASNGKEAWDIFENKDIQLVITDLQMPDMDGIKLIEKIREKSISVPIIVLTAHTETEYILPCANHNIQAYIIKPVNAMKLKEALYKAITYLNFTSNIYLEINKDLKYDKINGILIEKNDEYKLNNKERSLMDLLAQNKNKLITYSQIEQEIWLKNDEVMSLSALRTVVKNLRKKSSFDFIENVSGSGYKLIAP